MVSSASSAFAFVSLHVTAVRFVSDPDIDWDGLFTFGLTVLVIVGTLGAALIVAVQRVVTVARMHVHSASATELLIVPGKRLVEDKPDGDFGARLRRAAELSQAKYHRRILILGGKTAAAAVSEAEAGEIFVRSLPGAGDLSILQESASRNTLSNLRNVRDMLGESLNCGGRVTLISNRYHLARLGLIADSLGVAHLLWPAEDSLRLNAAMALTLVREALFWLWFRVGKRWALLTRNARMLARVT